MRNLIIVIVEQFKIFFSIMNCMGLAHGASIVEISPGILSLKKSRNMIISRSSD